MNRDEDRSTGAESVERRLRLDSVDDRPYKPGRFAALVENGLLERATPRPGRVTARATGPFSAGIGTAATAIVLIAATALVLTRFANPVGTPGSVGPPADLRARVTASGVLRVAVRTDHPQVSIPGRTFAGFDVDVANELARRLGVRGEVVITTPEAMVAADAETWDVALLSRPVPASATSRLAMSEPYYYWLDYLVGQETPPTPTVAGLDGQVICVVAGTAAESWINGTALPSGVESRLQRPTPGQVHALADDAACLAEVGSGASGAMVSATLSAADVAVRPNIGVIGSGPALVEERDVLAARGGPDPTSLLDDIDAQIRAMQADGTLVRLSRSRFGGTDLTMPPRP
jgi:ABC-type amino acid transport substrate-binding protein